MKRTLPQKITSIVLIAIVVCSILPLASINASASIITQIDAVAWANAQVGKKLDYDGAYGAQCVDLIKYYYNEFGVASYAKGNGSDYASNNLPTGWSRIAYTSGFVAQPGDIAVWTNSGGSNYGHVAIVISATSSKMNVVEQNHNGTGNDPCNTYSYSYGSSSMTFYGVIRPSLILFTPRTSAPEAKNKYYIKTSKGGLNACIMINDSTGSCLPNCVGYAYGRAYEVLGTKPNLSTGNANGWFSYNKNNNYYPYGSEPKVGAIACWSGGEYGHVAFVENVSGENVTISQSHYGGAYWESITKTATQMKTLYGYTLQGYIYVLGDQNYALYQYDSIISDTYYLKNISTGKYLAADDKSNQANISVSDYNGGELQTFVINGVNKSYTILSGFNSNLRVNPWYTSSETLESGKNITLNIPDYELGNDQHWGFEAVSGGYIIHNMKNQSLVLGLDGNNVRVETRSGADDQIWALEPVNATHTYSEISLGTYCLKNKSNGKYLAADDKSNQANISVSDYNVGELQTFLIDGNNKSYSIYSVFDSNLRVNPWYTSSETLESGKNITLYTADYEWDNDQHWGFEAVSGGYIIHNMKDQSLVLGLDGNNVRVETRSGADDQIWVLETEAQLVTYSVKFVNYNGDVLSDTTYHYGDTVTTPGDPVKASDETYYYVFTGWDKEVVPVVADAEYKAVFEAKAHTWNKPTYSWASDYSKVTAKRVSKNDSSIYQTETVNTVKQTVEPDCENNGKTVFTAVFSSTAFLTQTCTRVIKKLGHDLIHHDAKTPTCTEIGWESYDTCSRCDYSTYAEISALGHSYQSVVSTPTCTKKGFTTYTCSHCGDSYIADYRDALGHKYGEPEWVWTGHEAKAKFTCSVCYDIVTVNATVTEAEDKGIITYTATAVFNEKSYSNKKTEYIEYTVKFVDYDGTVLSEKTYHYGDTVTVPNDPVRQADNTYTYTFKGWDKAIEKVTKDQTYTAVYTAVPTAVDENSPQVIIGSVSASAGNTVKIKISLKNNPGLASMKLVLTYANELTLTNIKYGSSLGGTAQQPQTKNSPVILNWFNGTENTYGDLEFAELTFILSDNAKPGDVIKITAEYNPEDVYNIDDNNIRFFVIDGYVAVIDHIPGDVNGDKEVNNKDVSTLFKYLSGWNVAVIESSLDINGDGEVNNKDVSTLFKYLSGWNVEIK